MRLAVVLLAALALTPGSASASASGCGLPTAGVRLADGLVRTCTAPAVAGSAADQLVVAPACAAALRCAAWRTLQGFGAPGDGILSGEMVVASADGATVYVASYDTGAPAVTAYAIADGAVRWTARHADARAVPFAITRAADGSLAVALTESSGTTSRGTVWIVDSSGATRASTPTGQEALDVAAAGDVVVAAGTEGTSATATAIDPRTGEVAWRTPWATPAPGLRTSGWRVAGTEHRAYLAVSGVGADGASAELTLLALDPATGALRGEHRRAGKGFPPAGLVTSPDGSKVALVAANSENGINEALTLGYDADAEHLWTARYRGCDTFKCSTRPWYGTPATFTADSRSVVVAGLGVTVTASTSWATFAYDAATGAKRWEQRTPLNVGDCFCGPSVAAAGDAVYATGGLAGVVVAQTAITTAFGAADGAPRWLAAERDPDQSATTSSLAVAGDRLATVGVTRVPLGAGRTTVAAFER